MHKLRFCLVIGLVLAGWPVSGQTPSVAAGAASAPPFIPVKPAFSTAGFFAIPGSPRAIFDFDLGWRFYKGDVPNAQAPDFEGLGLLVEGNNSQNIQISDNTFDATGVTAAYTRAGLPIKIGTVVQLDGGSGFNLDRNAVTHGRAFSTYILKVDPRVNGVVGQDTGVTMGERGAAGDTPK